LMTLGELCELGGEKPYAEAGISNGSSALPP
jgi:hypothetical protein